MRSVLGLLALVSAVCSLQIQSELRTSEGFPSLSFGDFGVVEEVSRFSALKAVQSEVVRHHFGLVGNEEWIYRNKQETGPLVTFRFDQQVNGMKVFAGLLAVHVKKTTREIVGITASIARNAPELSEAIPLKESVFRGLEQIYGHVALKVTSPAKLTYLVDSQHKTHLAWEVSVLSKKPSSMNGLQNSSLVLEPYTIFFDALTHSLIMDLAVNRKNDKDREIYDAQNGDSLPGVLRRSEGQAATGDADIDAAYDNIGHCYDYYYRVHGRNSYDDKGGVLINTCHYLTNYNNAFWNGVQMVYGDGDGVSFSSFAADDSVVCHELTHGVTEFSSGLIYWSESGALNEAFSDIMAVASIIWRKAYAINPALDWVIGRECTLFPAPCEGCVKGLRYMANPTVDGSSTDYYPERYTGFQDNRGVHWNSGIANLAYVLTVEGGVPPNPSSPRSSVVGIGPRKAEQVYYTAFTSILGPNSDFAAARMATEQAVKILEYSDNDLYSVQQAWTAVGVNGS